MYEVMARRYRPGRFEEVVGQEHIAGTLQNAIRRDRVAHAYIFTGGHGCGKTTMARILAKALDCVHGPTPEPCCQCHICLDIAAGRDADVMEIDGASNNGIEQIRQLREQAAYVPTRARFKIYIIDEVHMLSDGAFNALLKTLEEPPRHVKFILATTDPHKVPDTILSRCQRFDFRLVPAPKLAAFFKKLAGEEKAAISDDALDAVASFSGGSVRDGLVLLDQLLSFAGGEVERSDVEAVRGVAAAENVAGVFEAVVRQDVKAALAIVDEVASRGTSVGDFLDQLITFGRDLMLMASTGSAEGASAYGPARQTLLGLGREVGLESALLYLDVLVQARTRVRSRALTNPLVALEMAVARLSGLGGVTPVSEILANLGNLASLPAARPIPAPQPADEKKTENREPPAIPVAVPVVEERPVETSAPPRSPEPEPEGGFDGLAAPEPDEESRACQAEEPEDQCLEKCVAPLNVETVRANWKRVVEAVRERNPAYTRHMARIAVGGAHEDVVVLSGPPIAIETWEDQRRLNCLREAAAEVLGRPVMFEFKAVASREADESGAEFDEIRSRLIRDPAVDKVRQLFDGVVVDCEPAGEE